MGLFGKEKITLTLEKYDYKPGDKIKGTIKLNLKKPTHAIKLEVAFIGRKVTKQSSMAVGPMVGSRGRGKHGSSTQYVNVFDFKMPLSGEQDYQNEEVPFEIKIPGDILSTNPSLEGKLGQGAQAVRLLTGVSSRIDWIVKAQLDIPMAFDVKKSQKIILSK